MAVSRHDVTKAILAYLEAFAAAQCCRSVSGQLLKAAELGCRTTGGRAPVPRIVGLCDCEKPLALCTTAEKRLFYERYWVGTVSKTQVREGQEYIVRVWRPWKDVAAAVGAPSVAAAKKRNALARAKVATMIRRMRNSETR